MTKLQLLEKTTEENIFKHYIPDLDLTTKKNYRSPFGEKDNIPSLSIFEKDKQLKFNSHNSGNAGDVFQFVADLKGIDCKTNFPAVIEEIAKDLNLNGFALKSDKKENIKISFEKDYTDEFLKYFVRFKINKDTLKKFNVQQVKYHEFISANNKHCKFDYRKNKQISVCYTINNKIKIYFPSIEGLQKKAFGFKEQTTEEIFGFTELKKADYIIISAGEKDCLSLNSNGFQSVSFQSENNIPTDKQINDLKQFASKLFICYDNDESGFKATEKLIKKFNFIKVNLPAKYKDVADFFEENNSGEFQKILELSAIVDEKKDAVKKDKEPDNVQGYTVFHDTENYLNKNYNLRFNSVKLEIEIAKKNSNEFKSLNENSLFVEINKFGIKVGMDKLIAILKSDFVKEYNPLTNYFLNLPKWDKKTDYVSKLCSFIDCDEYDEFYMQFTKWLIRTCRSVFENGFYNKQAFILVHSKQNSGKTTFCRFLCPPKLSEYIAENITDDKDSRIAIAKNFIINLDELSTLAKQEINSLKSLFSKDVINERLPYDRKTSIINRVASFIGSTNMAEFLTDETGSVRWLCFEIKSIDWKYKKEVDINKLWAQIYALYMENTDSDLTPEDIAKNEKRNKKFQQLTSEAEIIPQFLQPAKEGEPNAVFMSATEILIYLTHFTTIRLNKISIGRGMPSAGFHRCKDGHTDRYGYWCIKLK